MSETMKDKPVISYNERNKLLVLGAVALLLVASGCEAKETLNVSDCEIEEKELTERITIAMGKAIQLKASETVMKIGATNMNGSAIIDVVVNDKPIDGIGPYVFFEPGKKVKLDGLSGKYFCVEPTVDDGNSITSLIFSFTKKAWDDYTPEEVGWFPVPAELP